MMDKHKLPRILHLGAYPERYKAPPFSSKTEWENLRAPDTLFADDKLGNLSVNLPNWAHPNKFDSICMLHLLEYIHPWHAGKLLQEIISLLNETGVLVSLTYDPVLAGMLLGNKEGQSYIVRTLASEYFSPEHLLYGTHRIGATLPKALRTWSWSASHKKKLFEDYSKMSVMFGRKAPYAFICAFKKKPEPETIDLWQSFVFTMIGDAGIFQLNRMA